MIMLSSRISALASFFAISLGITSTALAQSQDGHDRIEQLAAATSITQSGTKPWHLRMTFDLYDLQGKFQEVGTVEEWWVSPTRFRTEIISPSFHQTIPAIDSSPNSPMNRSGKLIHQLLAESISPVPHFFPEFHFAADEVARTLNNVHLTCLNIHGPMTIGGKNIQLSGPTFCLQAGSYLLRTQSSIQDGSSVVYNHPGIFQGKNMALDVMIGYAGKIAIKGQIEKLETFLPENSHVALSAESDSPKLYSAGFVTAGKLLEKYQPDYPVAAKAQHIGGAVVLSAKISTQGKVDDLYVISSPSPLLSAAAINAVSSWKYQPYMVNGKAAEVDTTITSNFILGGR